MTIKDIKKNIKQLPPKKRAALAQWILENLDKADETEKTVDAAWRMEVRTRVNEIRDGKVDMIPSEKMWKDLLSGYGKTS